MHCNEPFINFYEIRHLINFDEVGNQVSKAHHNRVNCYKFISKVQLTTLKILDTKYNQILNCLCQYGRLGIGRKIENPYTGS